MDARSNFSNLVILWIYGAREVTRTFTETGETVAHLEGVDWRTSQHVDAYGTAGIVVYGWYPLSYE